MILEDKGYILYYKSVYYDYTYNFIARNNRVCRLIDNDNSKGCIYKGDFKEVRVKNLLYFLDGVDNVTISNKGSELDVRYGVDVFYAFSDEPDISYGLQVKSNIDSAKKYLTDLRAKSNISCSAIIVIDNKASNVELLYKLAEMTNQTIKSEIEELISLFNKFKYSKEIPVQCLKLSSFQKTAMQVLGLGRIKDKMIILNNF